MKETPAPAGAAGDCNLLAGLGLSEEDYRALARQGFLAAEFRRRGRRRLGPYYKLRWRRGGRQRVRYVGQDPARAERLRAALDDLQRPARLARQLSRLMDEARRHLRRAKEALAPHLAGQGLRYHGFTARRPRTPAGQAGAGAPGAPTGINPATPAAEDRCQGDRTS
jgi:hypothetical protein